MVLIALGMVRALGSLLLLLGPSTYYIEEKFFGPAGNIIFVLLLAGICGARYCFRGAPGPSPMKVICVVGLLRSLVLK